MTPEGWEEVRLGDFARMRSGGTPLTSVPAYYGGDIPWASISDMSSSRKYLRVTERYLTEEGLKNSAAVCFPPRTLLYAMYASIGECCISTCEVSTSQAILGIECGERLNVEFLFYVMQSRRAEVVRSGQQGTQANLNAQMVREMRVALPGAAEQQAIAEALSDADALVELLDALIAKKRDMKQAAMQQLLTGRTRLVGFTNGMQAVRLGDVVRMESGTYLPQTGYSGGQVKVQGAGGQMGWTDKPNFQQPVTVIGRVGTIGKPRFHDRDCWVNNNAAALVCTSVISPKFLYFVVQDLEFGRFTSTTAQPFLSVPDFLSAVLSLPSLEEQQAIETVLWDMDAEIDALVAQREKAELVKQGMMQELLSGRVRLV